MLFVKISAGNSSSSGFGRSAIVICPLESIIQDQVLESQSIGVTACSLSAKERFWSVREYTASFFCKDRGRSKFQIPAMFWLVYFPAQIMGAERNIQ